MLERLRFYRSTRIDFEALRDDLLRLLAQADVKGAKDRVSRHAGALEGDVLLAGLSRLGGGESAVREAMASAKIQGRLRLRRNLAFLGTLGNNAPFIGLFGTVLGVIKAFHDLASKKGLGPEAVMGSLSEALIATAVGLLVALPAVGAFNYFQGLLRGRLAQADGLAHDLLSELRDGEVPQRSTQGRAPEVA
jgi:biopolymer transport protein ExbB